MMILNRLFSDKLLERLVNIVAYLFLIVAVLYSRSSESCMLTLTLYLIGILPVAMIVRGIIVMVKPNIPATSALDDAKEGEKEDAKYGAKKGMRTYPSVIPIAYSTLLTVILFEKFSGHWVLYLLIGLIGLLTAMFIISLFIKKRDYK